MIVWECLYLPRQVVASLYTKSLRFGDICGPISADQTLTEELMMRSLLSMRRLIENEDGVTAIEYGLIAALV
jgi:Flp/Fap pilin component